MKPFDLDPELKWLFCFTHPDDELSICTWMRRLVAAGATVYASWTHSVPTREREARNVANEIGLNQANLTFMHGPDGSICRHLSEFRNHFELLNHNIKPDRIVCGAFEQGHLDHDSTNFLINQVFDGLVLEVPLYHAYYSRIQTFCNFSTGNHGDTIHLLDEEREWKVRCAKMFPSQNIWSCLLAHEILQVCKLRRPQLLRFERMRFQEKLDFRQPQHSGRKLERVLKCKKWATWRESLEEYYRHYPDSIAEATPKSSATVTR